MILPIQRINERLQNSIEDSDTSYFLDLMLAGEQLVKIVTAGLVTCIIDDNKRHRYSQIYRLLRADGIGEWSAVIDEVLTGISSQFFNPVVNHLQRELTERLNANSWQYKSIDEIINCLKIVDNTTENISVKVSGKTWFSLFANLRNKTKGHGAYSSAIYSKICVHLCESIKQISNNYSLLIKIEWAYLHRNLSGKYKISDISNNAGLFQYLRTDRTPNFENGVYIFLNKPTKVELTETNSDLTDFYFPNGGFNNKRYEVLSYISGTKNFKDANAFLTPPGDLPSSETEGLGKLDLIGNTFSNLPTSNQLYIKRLDLEKELKKTLIDDRHPIVTLTGRGGIGKTSLAISVLNELCFENRFSVIVWFSARDIDLLMEGAKPVKPHVFSADDISKEYVKLLEPRDLKSMGLVPKSFMEKELGISSSGSVLFIFDNFETVKDPIDLFQWIDTYIRNPNKVLITSRFRDFKGDYPIEVSGMNENEFTQLVNKTAQSLGITSLINSQEYLDELYLESDGHPYVIKVLLGDVAKDGKIGKIKRIVAGKEEILIALFERTFNGLTPAAKRVFLTLSNWRSTIPEIALEAVLLREANEHMDVEKAIEELYKSSLINIDKSDKDGMRFISIPFSASVFGKKKLMVSPMKTVIETDTKLLQTFGVGLNTEIQFGIEPRIIKFFRDIAKKVSGKINNIETFTPILEFICRKYPYAWVTLSSLYEEVGKFDSAISALQSYLEFTEDEFEKFKSWQKLAGLYLNNKDMNGELNCLIELCELKNIPVENISLNLHRINSLLKITKLQTDSYDKEIVVNRIRNIFIKRTTIMDDNASDFSQLSWFYIHTNDFKNARIALQMGLTIDPDNIHCLKLIETLS